MAANPSTIAEEVAEDMTSQMFDNLLSQPLCPVCIAGGFPDHALMRELARLRGDKEQLDALLSSAKSDLEFAALREEAESKKAAQEIADLQRQVGTLKAELNQANADLEDTKARLGVESSQRSKLEESVIAVHKDLAESQDRCDTAREELAKRQADANNLKTQREQSLEEESSNLRAQVENLRKDLLDANTELERRKEMPSTQPTTELPAENSDDQPLLAAAYQQIGVLNTQLAHLYSELTLARNEVERCKVDDGSGESRGLQQKNLESETQRQSQQIADLVSDIRHLQLDLEYHQQKLDQMIEEKQQMMKDQKKAQTEIQALRQQVDERDQMLKHREVDLAHMKQEAKSPRGPGSVAESDTLKALRAEAAAKDSALIVSHYELHKEKLMRDRMEQTNLKLMERMQKLMMVVETMRKENVSLERNLVTKERSQESREVQLRQMNQKAKQLQKALQKAKGDKRSSSRNQKAPPSLELEGGSGQSLPPLDCTSGMSTPRTGRAPPSPYTAR